MANITFTLGFKSAELRHLSLPIQVHKLNSALVARIVALKPVPLQPGRYYASAVLPAGQQLLQEFEVSDEDKTVELVPDTEDLASNEWQEAAHYLQAARPPAWNERAAAHPVPTFGLESKSDDPAPARVISRVRMFEGNPTSGTLALRPWTEVASVTNVEQGAVVQFRVSPHPVPLLAQLIEPAGAVQNMMVPVTPETPALLVFTRRPDATCRMEAHLENATADMLLRYIGASATKAAEEASRALLDGAEQLLADKRRDPLAAAIGATAILRFGRLEWLHTWTSHLDGWFDWFPDGAAIYGEHLARKGNHVDAAVRFCDVPRRGLPLLSDALFNTVERLKWYTELTPERAGGIDQAEARKALANLLPFAAVAHRQRSITSFPGDDPTTPQAEAPTVPDPGSEAIDLAGWLD
jgi:hypothetical protein